MKKINLYRILLAVMAVCTFGLHSCQEFDIDSQPAKLPAIDIDAQAEYAVLAESPENVVFNVSANTPWKITSDQNWCVPSPAMSASSSLVAEISVNIADYDETTASRTATLTITADGVEASQTIKIVQSPKGELVVTNFADEFLSEGNAQVFRITSNYPWRIINTEEWLSLDKTEGEGNGSATTVTVTASQNTGLKRSSALTVVSNGKEQKINAVQKGIILEFAETSEDDVTFDGGADNQSKTFEVVSNVAWTASTDAAWLNITSGAEGVTATAKSEIYFTTRKATITLTPSDKTLGLEPYTLEVKQVGGTYVKNPETANIVEDAATGAITITEETGNATSRFYIDKRRKLAIHEWTFSNVQVDDNRCFNMNCVEPPVPSWNFWLGVGANPWTFRYRGGTLNDNTQATPFDLNSMRALKIAHDYVDPSDRTKVRIEVSVKLGDATEWTKVLTTPVYENLFETAGSRGNMPFFGFIGGSSGKSATATITSYEVTNIE